MKKFALVIYGSPASPCASTALNFAKTVLQQQHEIYRLFFFLDGVHNASSLIVPPQDEINLPREWQSLIEAYKLDAVVCVASALQRGILNESEADRYEKTAANLLPGFNISGLGQLIDASIHTDRLINFMP